MKYENRQQVQEIFGYIDDLEEELLKLKESNVITFSNASFKQLTYTVLTDPETRQQKAVREFYDDLKSRIEDEIALWKNKLKEL